MSLNPLKNLSYKEKMHFFRTSLPFYKSLVGPSVISGHASRKAGTLTEYKWSAAQSLKLQVLASGFLGSVHSFAS